MGNLSIEYNSIAKELGIQSRNINEKTRNQLAKNQQPPPRYRATRDDVRSADARVYESGGVGENLGGEESNVLFPYEESPVDKETSGHFLNVVDMSLDCDNDTLLILANPIGATCHTGEDSCFHRFHACLPGMNHKKIQRLMRELELQVRVRKSKKLTTYRGTIGHIAPNHLERHFSATKPNQKWVTDVTEFKAKDGSKV